MLYPILEQYDVDIKKGAGLWLCAEGRRADTAQAAAANGILRCRYACRQGGGGKCFGERYGRRVPAL